MGVAIRRLFSDAAGEEQRVARDGTDEAGRPTVEWVTSDPAICGNFYERYWVLPLVGGARELPIMP